MASGKVMRGDGQSGVTSWAVEGVPSDDKKMLAVKRRGRASRGLFGGVDAFVIVAV